MREKTKPTRFSSPYLRVLSAAFVAVVLTACHTTNNPTATEAAAEAIAAVQIRGNTPGQITQVATEVFQAHGYARGSKRVGGLVFEKPAGKMSNLAYGSWVGDTPVWTRVKLSMVSTGEAEYTLACRAFHVRDKGSSMEEEIKIGRMGSGPYQKLLDEVAARFRGTVNPHGPGVSTGAAPAE